MTVEGWKQIFDVATVVLLFLTFACGAGVLITTNAINKRQESQLRQFDKDLTGAKTELGKQQERAAKAEQGVAGLEEAASDAKAAQQRVETELAAQQERAAKAEKALVELQQRASPRRITKEQADKFRSAFEFTNRLHNPRIALAFMVGVPDAED
ncbi:MAG TPA: hypothetical protein VJN64_14410, partial [Terriglobales bacterium]|nr:hypothetical protein [Terriglobales bacterium]